jgi:hypothetical protein
MPATAGAALALLSWTAPGDDSTAGRATTYELRRSTLPITGLNFGAATPVPGLPAPAAPGTRESFTVSGLDPAVTHYFAIRTVDDRGNWSLISNLGIKPGTGTVDVPAGLRPTALSMPWPNPARSASRLVLSLAAAAEVEVMVFDSQGRRLQTLLRARWPAGETTVIWDLNDARGIPAPPGLYHVRARVGDQIFRRSIAVVR